MRDKPYQLPNLFHHEVGVARSAHLVYYAYISSPQCQLQWRYALLKVGPKTAVSFHVLSTGVCVCLHCSHPDPAKSKPRLVGLQLLLTDGVGKGDSLVYSAVVVLIGLVNRIFHKRSNGPEQFLFCPSRGMCLFHFLKGGAGLQQPNSFQSASAFCFCVF